MATNYGVKRFISECVTVLRCYAAAENLLLITDPSWTSVHAQTPAL